METIDARILAGLLKCPIDWHLACPQNELCYWLNYAWYRTVLNHKVDNEGQFFSSEDWTPSAWELDGLDPHERRALKINIDTWEDAARKSYSARFGRLRDMQVATPDDYPKHYCRPTSGDEDVAALSVQRGEGVLYPRMTVERQREEMWSALLELWVTHGKASRDANDMHASDVMAAFESIFATARLTIAREFCELIGCCNGEPTRYGALKYSFSAALVHLHPISAKEFSRHPLQVNGWLCH